MVSAVPPVSLAAPTLPPLFSSSLWSSLEMPPSSTLDYIHWVSRSISNLFVLQGRGTLSYVAAGSAHASAGWFKVFLSLVLKSKFKKTWQRKAFTNIHSLMGALKFALTFSTSVIDNVLAVPRLRHSFLPATWIVYLSGHYTDVNKGKRLHPSLPEQCAKVWTKSTQKQLYKAIPCIGWSFDPFRRLWTNRHSDCVSTIAQRHNGSSFV